MVNMLDNYFGVHEQALRVRSTRAQLLAENIANADTPNFKARDIDFAAALASAGQEVNATHLLVTDARHMTTAAGNERFGSDILFRTPQAATLDGNSVDSDFEKSEFLRNAVEYQASLKFIDGKIRNLMSAIKGD
ncbi:MAG: flagellar basal body rod protein FlgB [Gammaproteobacteria bacterium]|nr:flagellar basal body rod protein FlgB [Gammaproteobacteria bacterium]